jgi:cupin 2 domain-containing protein
MKEIPCNIMMKLSEPGDGEEIFEIIEETESFLIERIISNNAASPAEGWYEQDHDEWVMILQGSAVIEMSGSTFELFRGDSLLIRASEKHRVIYTSSLPLCVWIAVHQKNKPL